ncbi:MAG: murein biosynthesis integral membrane protein MurJ [Tepidisphaeraceae bacterium]|jgi:putative peptidoglycan lipid II flippase
MSRQAIPISDPEARQREKPASFVAHARLISALTLVSRILGIAREGVMSAYFGAGTVASAFAVAFKVPNLFRKLLGEGAISTAFIPLYVGQLKSGNEAQANRFAAAAVNLLTMILVALTLIGEAALWATAHWVHLRSENLLAVRLTAVMLPYVLLICGTAFLGGILQVHKRFALPALAPVLLNVIHIAVIVIGAWILMLGRSHGEQQIALQTRLAYWLAGFVLLAGVGQIAMLVPALRAVGFRPMWIGHFWTPAVRQMLRLSVPLGLALGVLQLSVVLDTVITVSLTRGSNPHETIRLFGHAVAYPLALGAVARLNWAQFLYQFPLGVFAIALATAIFPGLSADALDANHDKFNRVLRQGIFITLLEGLPASIGLILVRYPVCRLLLQHGRFTAQDTQWVALSVVFYSAAIWAFSLQQVMNRAYYALHDMTTPLMMSVVTIVVNTAVEIPLCFTRLGEAGMAVGTMASFTVQAVVMLYLLDRKTGGLGIPNIAASAAKMLLACALMTGACLLVQRAPFYPHATGTLASVEQLAILISVGAATYAGVCWRMGLGRGE